MTYNYDLIYAIFLWEDFVYYNYREIIGKNPALFDLWPNHHWKQDDVHDHYCYLRDSSYFADGYPALTYSGREFVKLIRDKTVWDEAIAACGPDPNFVILEWWLLEHRKKQVGTKQVNAKWPQIDWANVPAARFTPTQPEPKTADR